MTNARRLTAALVAIILLATACGSPGLPASYEDQDGAEYENLLGETFTGPLVEKNYREGCEAANEDMNDKDAVEFCECTYNKWVDNVPYDVFEAFSNRLRDKSDTLEGANFDQLSREYDAVIDELEEELEASGADYETELLNIIGFPCTNTP